jgi:hypothetical protein
MNTLASPMNRNDPFGAAVADRPELSVDRLRSTTYEGSPGAREFTVRRNRKRRTEIRNQTEGKN